jgi:Domain of unknown function (DUF4055)
MAINTTHPLYDKKIFTWQKLRDCYAGTDTIKNTDSNRLASLVPYAGQQAMNSTAGTIARHYHWRYLPPTAGMVLDGMQYMQPGYLAYEAYKMRAVFHDFVKEAVESYVGLLHQKPAVFELPEKMKSYLNRATDKGESLQQLLRRINEEQLVSGRAGLLADLPEQGADPANPLPYITMYKAELITNWDDSDDHEDMNRLGLVVLNESSDERMEDYVWKFVEKYRVLEMQPLVAEIEGAVTDSELTDTAEGEPADEIYSEAEQAEATVYRQGLFYTKGGTEVSAESFVQPTVRGAALNFIPFVFINSKDTTSMPDQPPLEGLADLCLTMYRGEADYRQNLYMQGQDTLVVQGSLIASPADGPDSPLRVGAGQRINVDIGGDAKYIGVNHAGLSEQRTALENDKKQASERAGKLIAPAAGKQESGDALSTRMAAQTATLNSIALCGAAGLEKSLKMIAIWIGEDPDKVKVFPNLEFADFLLDGKSMVDFMTARTMGLPLSKESIHGIMVDRGLTSFTFEEETAKFDEENAAAVAKNVALGLNPDGSVIMAPRPLKGDTLGTASGHPEAPPTLQPGA